MNRQTCWVGGTFVDDEDEDNSLLTAPCDNLDLNAIAWLEDYLQSWEGTILVV